MEQVSVGALKTFINSVAEIKNVSVADLLQNSPLPELSSLTNKQWVSWNQMAQLFHWLDQSAWAPIDWVRVGDVSFQPKNFSIGAAVCRLTLSIRSAYWIGAKWFGPSQIRVITCEFSDLGPNQIRQVMEIPSNLDPCPQIFAIILGSHIGLPRVLFSEPDALVKATIEGRKAIYDITFPGKVRFRNKCVNVFKSIFNINDIFSELSKQQVDITNGAVALIKERSEFETLIERFPDGVIIHHQGEIVFVNDCMKSFLNHRDEKLIGLKVFDFICPEHVDIIKQRISDLKNNPLLKNPPMEISFRMFGSENSFFGECTSMQFTYRGQPSVAVVVRDLSDRKNYEKHLVEADRLTTLGQLAAGVGHEINNPLCYVILKLESISQKLRGKVDPAIEKDLASIDDGLTRIQTIVHDLKALSRQPDENKIENVDVAQSLSVAIAMANNEIQHRAVLEVDVGELRPVSANEARLGQVFLNLLINAAHAIEPGNANSNKISIKAYNDNDKVVVVVSDTGAGIPDAIKQNLFKPFFTTKPIGQGTGLGLSICQSIINRYGGRISFVSEAGSGTAFTVSIPASTNTVSQRNKPESNDQNSADLHKKTVLVIDDDQFLLEAISEVVSTKFIVVSKVDAAEALECIIAGQNFDAILCDLMMPNMDGIEFYNKLKILKPELCERVIYLTGGSFTDRTNAFLSQPEIKVCQKPVRRADLINIIDGVVAKAASALKNIAG